MGCNENRFKLVLWESVPDRFDGGIGTHDRYQQLVCLCRAQGEQVGMTRPARARPASAVFFVTFLMRRD